MGLKAQPILLVSLKALNGLNFPLPPNFKTITLSLFQLVVFLYLKLKINQSKITSRDNLIIVVKMFVNLSFNLGFFKLLL